MNELYSSVCPQRIIDDWIPITFIIKKIRSEEFKCDILLIDFVQIGA